MKGLKIIFIIMLISAYVRAEMLTLTPEECLSAVSGNLSLESAGRKIELAKALTGTYFDVPNTNVELKQSSTEGGGMDNGLTFTQEFDFPSVYVAKRKVLKAEERLAREEFDESLNRIRGEVASSCRSIIYDKARLSLLRESLRLYEDFARISRVRYEAGESSRLEYLNAERMLAKIETNISEIKLELTSHRQLLGSLLGVPDAVDVKDSVLTVIEVPELYDDIDPGTSYKQRLLDARLDIDESNVNLARQEFWPGLSVSATSQLLIKGFNPYHLERERFTKGDFMGFSVGVTVPLFFGAKRSRFIAARRSAQLTRALIEEEKLKTLSEFEALRSDLLQASQRLDYYERQGLSRADELFKLAAVSYELGEIDYLEYMQNVEAATEIRLEYLESIDRYNHTAIKILTLKGKI